MQKWAILAGLLCIGLAGSGWIICLPKQRIGTATHFFEVSPTYLKETILDVKQQTLWRKELGKVELTETGWIEYLKSGERINFQLVRNSSNEIQLNFQSQHGYSGTWHAQLIATGSGTTIVAKENIVLETITSRIVSHLFFDPEKIAQIYLQQLHSHIRSAK